MKKIIDVIICLCASLIILEGCNQISNVKPYIETAYEKGKMTAEGFESKYMDLRFTVPENYIMATDEDINSMMNIGADFIGLDEKVVDYAKLTTVYEMAVSASIGSPNIIVMTEKLMLSNMTLEQYFENLKRQLSNLEVDIEIIGDKESIEIAGENYQKMDSIVSMYGQSMKQSYILRKIDNRVVGFVTTSTFETEEELNGLLRNFTKF